MIQPWQNVFILDDINVLVAQNPSYWPGSNTGLDVTQFTFTDQTGVPLGIQRVSNIVTITGTNVPVPVTVTGGEYRINSGAWRISGGMIENYDTLQLRTVSSNSSITTIDVLVSVGTTTDTWSVTTFDYGTSPVNPFGFTDVVGVDNSTLVMSNIITYHSVEAPTSISIIGGEYSINGGIWLSSIGTIQFGDTVRLRQTSSSSNNAITSASITIGTSVETWFVTTRGADVNIVLPANPPPDNASWYDFNGIDGVISYAVSVSIAPATAPVYGDDSVINSWYSYNGMTGNISYAVGVQTGPATVPVFGDDSVLNTWYDFNGTGPYINSISTPVGTAPSPVPVIGDDSVINTWYNYNGTN